MLCNKPGQNHLSFEDRNDPHAKSKLFIANDEIDSSPTFHKPVEVEVTLVHASADPSRRSWELKVKHSKSPHCWRPETRGLPFWVLSLFSNSTKELAKYILISSERSWSFFVYFARHAHRSTSATYLIEECISRSSRLRDLRNIPWN